MWQRRNGTLEVISGRHRLDLAKRTGTEFVAAYVYVEDEQNMQDDQADELKAAYEKCGFHENIRFRALTWDGKGEVDPIVDYARDKAAAAELAGPTAEELEQQARDAAAEATGTFGFATFTTRQLNRAYAKSNAVTASVSTNGQASVGNVAQSPAQVNIYDVQVRDSGSVSDLLVTFCIIAQQIVGFGGVFAERNFEPQGGRQR